MKILDECIAISLLLTTLWPDPVPVDCRKKADVVFVVDSTSNLRYRDFRLYVLGTVSDIIQHLDVHSGRTRVAAVQFTNVSKVWLLLLFTNVAYLCIQ